MYENPHERKIAEAMGYADSGKPYVSFFDHAVPDKELTQKSGRPRFQAAVYIQKIPSAPDLVKRDVFARKATEEDKREFPEEWQKYLSRKGAIDNMTPPVTAIPGMNVAAKAELDALGITNCAELIAHKDNLDELEPLRITARRIMEVSNEVREGRQTVRTETDRQQNRPPRVSWGSPQEEEVFSYSFKI